LVEADGTDLSVRDHDNVSEHERDHDYAHVNDDVHPHVGT
jgi:hypothetical protein